MIDNWTIDGSTVGYPDWTLRVSITEDDTRPETDGEWASADDIAAWKRDDWHYVVVQVTAVDTRGRVWEDDTDTLGAVVWGTLGNGTDIGRAELERDILPDMIRSVMAAVTA